MLLKVENLFLVEELLLVINDILSPGDSKVENIKNKIIEFYQSQKIHRYVKRLLLS